MGNLKAKFQSYKLAATNNYPLCRLNDTCVDPEEEIDPTTGPVNTESDIYSRTLGVTFESLYQNYASYPSTTDASNKQYIIKKFFLEDQKEINIIIDMLVKGTIVTTITGDTGYDHPLVKTTVFDANRNIDTVYSI